MSWSRWLERIRKLAFGLVGLAFLAWGLWFMRPSMPAPETGKALDPITVQHVAAALVSLYSDFQKGVWAIVAAVVLGNVGEHLAGALKKPAAPQPPAGGAA